jgi:hypothetical protein
LQPYEYWDGPVRHYEKWLGNDESAALFLRLDILPPETIPLQLADMKLLFETDNLNTATLAQTMVSAVDSLNDDFIVSMRALSTFNSLYKRLKQSTIDVRVFSGSLLQTNAFQFLATDTSHLKNSDDEEDDDGGNAEFGFGPSPPPNETDSFQEAAASSESQTQTAPPTLLVTPEMAEAITTIATSIKWRAKRLTIRESFSAILYLESNFCIHPNQLQNVMAISSGNSMFISNALVSDPSHGPSRVNIRHVMGNVGRPGTALLVPPLEPRIMKLELDHWHLVNLADWDGGTRDCFADTTLHLWFTGKTQEVDIGFSGAQDTELYILESVVSVHGRGQWIADLDIGKALTDKYSLCRWRGIPSDGKALACRTPNPAQSADRCAGSHDMQYRQDDIPLTALENWSELLSLPANSCVFLASGNWQARLAATVIAVALRKNVCVLRESVCWGCIKSLRDLKMLEDSTVFIL